MIIEGRNEKLNRYLYLEVSSIEFDEQWNITNFTSIADLDTIEGFKPQSELNDWSPI